MINTEKSKLHDNNETLYRVIRDAITFCAFQKIREQPKTKKVIRNNEKFTRGGSSCKFKMDHKKSVLICASPISKNM
jgi:hypothetical protein